MEKIIILVLLVLAFCIAVLLAYMGVRTGGRTIIKPPEHLRDKGMPKYKNPPMPPIASKEAMDLYVKNRLKNKKALVKITAMIKDAQEAEDRYIQRKQKGNCYKNCGNTKPSIGKDKICLNCGSSIIK